MRMSTVTGVGKARAARLIAAATQARFRQMIAAIGADRDRGAPHGAAPATPPGIRVTYHGGSIELSRSRNIESG